MHFHLLLSANPYPSRELKFLFLGRPESSVGQDCKCCLTVAKVIYFHSRSSRSIHTLKMHFTQQVLVLFVPNKFWAASCTLPDHHQVSKFLQRQTCQYSNKRNILVCQKELSKYYSRLNTAMNLSDSSPLSDLYGDRYIITKTLLMGIVGGMVGTLIGVGGGIVLTPLMTSFLKIKQQEAHGTSLVAVSLSSFVGSMTYYFHSNVDFLLCALLCIPALVSAGAGAKYSSEVPSKTLKKFFGGFLILVSLSLIFKSFLKATMISYVSESTTLNNTNAFVGHMEGLRTPILALCILVGTMTGFLSGLLGIGGGSILVPTLVLAVGLTQRLAQGTALASMVIPSVLGCRTHFALGHVKVNHLWGLLPGVMIGSLLGGKLVFLLPQNLLPIICGVVFGLTGIRHLRQK